MKRLLIGLMMASVLIGGVVAVRSAWAQAGPQVTVGQAFDLKAPHNGARTTSYLLTISGPAPYTASLPVSALSGGFITFQVPGRSAAGNYSAIISVVGPGGTTPSPPFGFEVVVAAPDAVGAITLVPR